MSRPLEYFTDSELASPAWRWCDRTEAPIDFSSGWTFTARVVADSDPSVLLLTTTHLTGYAASATDTDDPNVVLDWQAGDLAGLTGSVDGTLYQILLTARRTSDSKDRRCPGPPLTFVLYSIPA